MAGQGGPDEQTWNKMTSGQKRAYWICIGVICALILIGFCIRFLR
jgi:hypothetical protein